MRIAHSSYSPWRRDRWVGSGLGSGEINHPLFFSLPIAAALNPINAIVSPLARKEAAAAVALANESMPSSLLLCHLHSSLGTCVGRSRNRVQALIPDPVHVCPRSKIQNIECNIVRVRGIQGRQSGVMRPPRSCNNRRQQISRMLPFNHKPRCGCIPVPHSVSEGGPL